MRSTRTPLVLASLAVLAAPPAAACPSAPNPSAPMSDREIREELRFAEGLATDWQFVELAESVLDDIDQSKASDALKEEIGLTRCDVYASSARRERDDARKLALYDKALAAYTDYLDEFRFATNRAEAERRLVSLARAFGLDVYRLYSEAVGDRAKELRTRIQDVLTDAVGRTSDLATRLDDEIDERRELDEATSNLEREKYGLLLNRGEMLLTIAQVSEDGTYFFDQALETLESVSDSAGEDSVWGLQAFMLMGRVFTEMGDFEAASDYLSYVVELAVPTDPEVRANPEGGFDTAPQATKDANWLFCEAATAPLIEAFLADGNTEGALLYALHFQNCLDEYGFSLGRPMGYFSMLASGRALLDAGGWIGGGPGEYVWFETREDMADAGFRGRRNTRAAIDLALQMTQRVNRDNRGNTLQLLAQDQIAEIIDRGVAVDPEILFEAAQGAYFQERFMEAIEGFKRVLAVLETGDDATRTRLGPEVLWYIGRSFQKSGRHLEAAMTFRRALDDRWRGDPKYDPENAKQFNNSISIVHRGAGEDPALEALFRESQDLVVKMQEGTGDAGDILYDQALRAYREKDYEDARDRFLEVPGSAKDYEKALAYAAVALNKLGQPDAALEELDRYLNEYVTDPVRTPTTESGIKRRKEAMGLARYYGGLIHFNKAEAGTGSYETVLEWLDDYASEFPDQVDFGPKTVYISLASYLKLGDRAKAEERRDRLVRDFENSAWTGIGAYEIYKVNRDLREKAEEGDARYTELTRGMANNLSLYNRLAGDPKLNNLRIEAKLWEELGEWQKVKSLLQLAVDRFGGSSDKEVQDSLTTSVLPDLAHALLELREVRDAAAILGPLVRPEDARPSSTTARNYCRAVTGWVEGTETEFVEVPGVGETEEEFLFAAETLIKLANLTDKWECYWYELKFELAYANYQWGQLDGKRLESGEKIIDQLQVDVSPGLSEIATACGDEVLRQRFLWLEDKF